ncbi:DNA cytosine methyltransferase [Nocardia niigatensis]
MTGTDKSKPSTPLEQEKPRFTSIEICAGAGGQAVGLHQAGFGHLALVEIDEHAVETLKLNIRGGGNDTAWATEGDDCRIISKDVKAFEPLTEVTKGGRRLAPRELDLLAGGVPCPPFSHAGKQLGKNDERDLFPRMLELVGILEPRAVMIENVRGIMDDKFTDYRKWITTELESGRFGSDSSKKGPRYKVCHWGILEASKFGVPQLRPRAILVAFREDVIDKIEYNWPESNGKPPVTVAASLEESMLERFTPHFTGANKKRAREAYDRWHAKALAAAVTGKSGGIAPTLVGGSKKHGGADLGPSRAKAAWRQLGISGMGVANDIETCRQKGTQERDLLGADGPMLTVQQAAIIQGFPSDWRFSGGKTAQYRQVGNAFPPPVARAVGESIIEVLRADSARRQSTDNDQVEKKSRANKRPVSNQLHLPLPMDEDLRAS